MPDSVHLRDFPKPDPSLVDEPLEASMEAVRRTVELGRAARAQAAVKVRQPLRRAIVVANDAEREAISARARDRDLGAQRQGAGVRRRGIRAGQLRGEAELPLARPALRQADAPGRRRGRGARRRQGRARRSTAGLEVGINVEGREHALGPDDLTLVMQPLDGYQVEAAGRPRGRAGPGARRRAPPRGAGARDRPRRAERPPRGRPRGHRPDRADAGGRRGAPGRRSRPRGIRRRRDARHLGLLRRRREAAGDARSRGGELRIAVERSG